MLRLQLLRHLDLLSLFQDATGGYDVQAYTSFRQLDLVDTALTWANRGELTALHALFARREGEMAPHRLSVLSKLPELIPPEEYRALLPQRP